jgi:hypothetical protein
MKLQVCLGCLLLLIACGKPDVQPKSAAPSTGIGFVQRLTASALPKEKFDLCYYSPTANASEVADSIVGLLRQAKSRGVFIVIGSEGVSKQKEIVSRVCSKLSRVKLIDSKIAVIGSKEDQAEFETMVRTTGAEFIFIEFIK